jgi:hypothetical protein
MCPRFSARGPLSAPSLAFFSELFKPQFSVSAIVAVEKGTKAVISVDFSFYGEPTFNNLRTNFVVEIPRKEFFNSHACLQQLSARYTMWA